MTQFSLFGAEAATPTLTDLDGLPLGGGRWVRSGARARISVVVADRWRADALVAEFGTRGVGGEVVAATDGWSARTSFTADLAAHAARWTRGANDGPPRDLALTASGLRLWTIATGHRDDTGYLLGTPRADDALHLAAGAQLSRLGLAAVSIGVRGGPGWRITSARRVRRFVELIGPGPDGCGDHWPSVEDHTG